MKKTLLIVGGLAIAIATVPMFAAFEAHVINVTAHIENALYVHPESQDFGTVFPQEFLLKSIFVGFSNSFSATTQTRVNTVEYKIVQKPKPTPAYEAEVGVDAARKWCHDNYPETPYDPQSADWNEFLTNCYPSLCPYLSKHSDMDENPFVAGNQTNDYSVPAFHNPWDPTSVARGKIIKTGYDSADTWVIDLAVPCFNGQCAQDWPDFVHKYNPSADPDAYKLPKELESQTFGCDLWIEVTDIYKGPDDGGPVLY